MKIQTVDISTGKSVENALTEEQKAVLQAEWEAEAAAIAAKEYEEKRRDQYPPITEQLDMLWHAMDQGEIAKATVWYDAVKEVKDANPKPAEVLQ